MRNETIQTDSGPQVIRCYDSGPNYTDRYAVFYLDVAEIDGPQAMLGMCAHPFHPQGFCQHGEGILGRHNGKRIPFASLPKDCQSAVLQDFRKQE